MSDGFWRVYLEEWSVVHVSDADGDDGARECLQKFRSEFQETVKSGEWRVVPWSSKTPEDWPQMLEVRVPVMKGEYREEVKAREHAAEIGGNVVLEGSSQEEELTSRAKTGGSG